MHQRLILNKDFPLTCEEGYQQKLFFYQSRLYHNTSYLLTCATTRLAFEGPIKPGDKNWMEGVREADIVIY